MLSSAEKSSARLAANGVIIKKIKMGIDKNPKVWYNKGTKKRGAKSYEDF